MILLAYFKFIILNIMQSAFGAGLDRKETDSAILPHTPNTLPYEGRVFEVRIISVF
jgi:hypothetical protein